MSNLQPSKENIQHFKTSKFLTFSIFGGHFCPPGYGSTDLIESGSGSETLPRRKGSGKILHPCLTAYLQTGGLQQVESELGRSHASQSSHSTISRFQLQNSCLQLQNSCKSFRTAVFSLRSAVCWCRTAVGSFRRAVCSFRTSAWNRAVCSFGTAICSFGTAASRFKHQKNRQIAWCCSFTTGTENASSQFFRHFIH